MATPYDEVAYPAVPFRQTHPDRLATHAALFGLPYAPVASCRVLDIGCGDGINLIAMAVTYPEARFVGLDLSEVAIARGREIVDSLGLANVRLEARDLLGADYGAGGFDYIIAHGVYSWVPAPVREGLLALVRHHLAPHGVAFVSHNALPGARTRQIVREMVLFHLRGIEGVAARLAAGRAALERIREQFSEQSGLHAQINFECKHMLERPPGALAHDELGDVFDPLYLHEFLAHAGRHGLQYLTEASATRCGEGFRPPYAIDDPDFDVLAHAQQLDFEVLRAYRENLLVHATLTLDRRPAPARLLDLWVSSPAEELEPELFATSDKRFNLTEPVLIAAARSMAAAWPQAVPVRDLIGDEAQAAALLRMYWVGLLHLHTAPMPFIPEVAERPKVSALARLQASRRQPQLTTPRHGSVEIKDDVGLRFIAGLDGTRTVAEIAADMAVETGVPEPDLQPQVVAKLAELARLPLFV